MVFSVQFRIATLAVTFRDDTRRQTVRHTCSRVLRREIHVFHARRISRPYTLARSTIIVALMSLHPTPSSSFMLIFSRRRRRRVLH